MKVSKFQHRNKRHARVRAKIKGTASIPRVSVFRSNLHIFAQIIDDATGKTLVSNDIKSVKKTTAKGTKIEKASVIGETLAKKAQETGINKVVFDRGGYKYHGRVKALADGLRKGGLKF
ncbi:MAG: 50S ribosomal protein L18 [Candidatus Yanofskybacteria bacterium]|nr:50S ribosomal protein L18 [Candidatus Yanofskybacteria bacterium]